MTSARGSAASTASGEPVRLQPAREPLTRRSCVRYSEYSIGAAETRRERKCAPRPRVACSSRARLSYRTITFIKWLMLLEVSGSVSASLFYDDDVVFFANPFGAFEPSVADFRHQTESGSGCAARPNGGLLYVRSSPQGVELLRNMVARKDEIEASGDRLDQDYVEAAAEAAGVSRCALPKREFAGHCRHAQEKRGQVGQLVSYHAHCCALAASKQALVRRVQAAREETPARPLREVDLEPLPGFDRVNDTCYKPTWGDLKALRGSLRESMRGINEAEAVVTRSRAGWAGSGRPEGHLR